MRGMNYIQIQKNNDEHFEHFLSLWLPYMNEIMNERKEEKNFIIHAEKVVSIQGNRNDMHLELCYDQDNLIGFCFYAVDLGGIRNIIDPNYGYIMEFYVKPQFRRLGYGKKIFKHIEDTFSSHEAEYMYLTPDEINGEYFWSALGFNDSGKKDPDNHMPIFIKKVEK